MTRRTMTAIDDADERLLADLRRIAAVADPVPHCPRDGGPAASPSDTPPRPPRPRPAPS